MNENSMVQLAKPLVEVCAKGNVGDRKWFIENPTRQIRLRYATMGEYQDAFPVVIVRRLADGSQVVMPLPFEKKDVKDIDNVSESKLEELWLALGELIDSIRKHDKAMQRK